MESFETISIWRKTTSTDLCQDVQNVSSFIWCHYETFPWRNCSIKYTKDLMEGNVPLRHHLLNEKSAFMSWKVFNEVLKLRSNHEPSSLRQAIVPKSHNLSHLSHTCDCVIIFMTQKCHTFKTYTKTVSSFTYYSMESLLL